MLENLRSNHEIPKKDDPSRRFLATLHLIMLLFWIALGVRSFLRDGLVAWMPWLRVFLASIAVVCLLVSTRSKEYYRRLVEGELSRLRSR